MVDGREVNWLLPRSLTSQLVALEKKCPTDSIEQPNLEPFTAHTHTHSHCSDVRLAKIAGARVHSWLLLSSLSS